MVETNCPEDAATLDAIEFIPENDGGVGVRFSKPRDRTGAGGVGSIALGKSEAEKTATRIGVCRPKMRRRS